MDNQDFILEVYKSTYPSMRVSLRFFLSNQANEFYFLSPEEVDEFCELLQEKKKEIWQEK